MGDHNTPLEHFSTDVADTDQSRIFFGPVNSPEKKLAATFNSETRLSPLRRSPRLSKTPEPNSRPITPENDGFILDEPPSVLASRIMRAHGNPSPPPQSPETAADLNLPTLSLPFPLTPAYEDPLISFEFSSVLPNAPDTPTDSNANILDQSSSIDVPTMSSDVAAALHTDAIDEQTVAEALVAAAPSPPAAEAVVLPTVTAESPHTPPRRSTRPRRSTARYSSPIRLEDLELDADEPKQPKPNAPTSPRKTITLVPYSTENPDPSLFVDEPRPRSPTRISAKPVAARELGSLSPSSVTILKSLLPPPSSPPREASEPDPALYTSPARVAPPIRFASPTRRSSPNKFRLHPAALDDPNITPARRIPIQTAVANGQISAQKGAQLLSSRRFDAISASRPMLHIPPNDSPARRVPLTSDDSISSSPIRKMPGSPTRSRSVEPRPTEPLQLKKRSESVDPSLPGKAVTRVSSFSRSVAVEKAPVTITLHPTIPEEGSSVVSPQKLSTTSAEKSRLKQPTSRIPRIGLKPYARPTASTTSKSEDKPSSIRQLGSKPSKSSTTKLTPLNSSISGRPQIPSSIPVPSPVKQKAPVPSTPTNLKRKRGLEGNSPTKPVPVVLLSTPKRPLTAAGRNISPIKKASAPQLRMVSDSDGILPTRPSATSSGSQASRLKEEPTTLPVVALTPRPVMKLRMVSDSDGILPDHPISFSSGSKIQEEEPLVPPIATIEQPINSEVLPSAPQVVLSPPTADLTQETSLPAQPRTPSPVESSEFNLRRTTRSSRSGISAPKPTSSSRPVRRKNVPTFPDTGPFSGMSALALRTLTDSNTTKNKEYLTALLQTEVVRREGTRPESPGMNIQTISQKEKEAKTNDRSARAERRAKRDHFNDKETGFEDNDGSDEDGENDLNSARKHAWGPGDEEEYESPIRPMKRLRLDDDVSEGSEADYDKKRVKWDRGLYREIFLDDIKPRTTHARITQESIKKGCLAPTSKALTLDTLGNLPNADSPLKDVMKENIVVKKFVYDDDVTEPVAPAPVKTRSKSKKNKS